MTNSDKVGTDNSRLLFEQSHPDKKQTRYLVSSHVCFHFLLNWIFSTTDIDVGAFTQIELLKISAFT